jgi:probable phosphoglycerate mutase
MDSLKWKEFWTMDDPNLTTMYLVRHGETDWNVQKKIQGQTDIPLNKTGELQAKELAGKFKDITLDLAFSSDLLRAERTAEIIALEHKLAVQTTNALRERNFGIYEGKPSDIFFTYLKVIEAMSHEERFKHKIDESTENDEMFVSRIITFLRETAVANPGKNILMATHGGVLHVLLVHLGAISYKDSDMTRFKNGSYVRLRSDGVDMFVDEIEGMIKVPKN